MSNKSLALAKAKLALLDSAKEQTPTTEKKVKNNQNYLYQALDSAEKCIDTLPEEETRILSLVQEIESKKDEDQYWEIRVKYHLHNLEVMKETYPIFSTEAKRRRAKIKEVDSSRRWSKEKEKCSEDTKYWFDNYAWTLDPRKSGVWALPFMLYPYQKDTIQWLESLIFTEQSSGLIEKSRDLGLSWLITSLLYKHWQHSKNEEFTALIGSMSADDCDKIGDSASLFEKLRLQSKLQPLGLLPKQFNPNNIPYMKIVNPENGSAITGSTANPDFGRGGRFKIILFDEFSAFEQDTAAMSASSQSSPCKLYNSTARGMGNQFHRLAHSGTIKKKTLRWQQHPYKNQDWYDYQKLEMNPVQIAQELDIDYNASQPNKVYNFDSVYHVVTRSEVMRALPQFRNSQGQWQIPLGHKIMMGYDVGQSEEHVNALLWFLTLRENTITVDNIDLSGHIFLYREMIAPPRTTPRNIARMIQTAEGVYEPRMIIDRVISHEQTTVRDALDWDYNIDFRKWTTDYNAGVARVRDYLEVVNYHEIHPFRDYSREVLFGKDAPAIMGRPHIFLVVDDAQGKLEYEPSIRKYGCQPPEDEDGLFRTRSEFPAYHYPSTELGKELRKMRPQKIFDDAMDVTRCVASECFAPLGEMSVEEKFEKYLPDKLKNDNIEKLPSYDRGMAVLQREQERREFQQQQASQYMSYRDRLWIQVKGK